MASVAIVFRKDKLNQKGEAPIHLRIIKHRRISYITSGIMLSQHMWDEKKNRIRSSHPNSARLNSFLTNKFAELQDQVFEHETISKSLTTRTLKEKIYGKKPTDFFPFADEVVEQYAKEKRFGSYDKNRSIIAKLKTYCAGRVITFQDITPAFLTKYADHLRSKFQNCANTIHKDMKFLRKVFNDAYRQDLIEHNQNPFLKYQMKMEKTQRTFLTQDELAKIETFQPTPGTRLELHRDMFVFATYTGGIRISDLLQLKWKNFDGTHIQYRIKKTGEQTATKVPNKGIEILRKYQPENNSPEEFIFHMLSDNLDLNDAREVDNQISRATAYVNKNLKIIARKTEINKRISFHVSRHSFACLGIKLGISIDKVSKIMKHSNIRETQVYAKIVSEELDKAMEVFN